MTTTATVVARALRLIQVIDAVQPVKPQDMTTAIEALNTMLVRWEASGLSLGWQSVAGPSDVLPLPDEALEAVAYNLAVKLAPEYGTPAPGLVIEGAAVGYADLLRDQAVATPIRPILDVPLPAAYGNASRLRSTVYDY